MPHGFPAATVITHDVIGVTPADDGCERVTLREGQKVAVVGRAADQDGARWDDVLVATEAGRHVMVPMRALRL